MRNDDKIATYLILFGSFPPKSSKCFIITTSIILTTTLLDKVSASLESSTSPCDWSVGFKIPEGGCLHFLFSMHSKMTCLQVL